MEKVCQPVQFQHRFVVADFRIGKLHVDHENHLLPQMVKGDHLVKQHQVHILKILGVLGIATHRRFAVAKVVKREISHQPAGKGRQRCDAGTFVLGKDLAELGGRVVGGKPDVPDFHVSIPAGDLQFGIKAQKGISAPGFVCLCRFQQIAVGGYILENPQHLDGGCEIGKQLGADRQHLVVTGGGKFFDLFQAG